MSINEAKDKVAVSHGFHNWDNLWLSTDADVTNDLIDECMREYGKDKATEANINAYKQREN